MVLLPGSPLYLYGPYKREGFATAPSNQAFDRNLRDRNPIWGLRDLEVGCCDSPIRWILGSDYYRHAGKQSERVVPPNVIVAFRGRPANEQRLSGIF